MSGGKFARRRERKPLPLRFLALLLLNVALVVLAVVFAVKLHHVTNLLITQSAAEVWKGQSEENFVQVSAFQRMVNHSAGHHRLHKFRHLHGQDHRGRRGLFPVPSFAASFGQLYLEPRLYL